MIDRRKLLKNGMASAFGLGMTLDASPLPAMLSRLQTAKHVLVRSSWQTVNIGDIAHTPGILSILEKHLPQLKVTLWPSNLDNGVAEILKQRFPKLSIAMPRTAELELALEQCDFLLHGSGASLVAERDVVRWHNDTGKPYGIYGITFSPRKSSKTSDIDAKAIERTCRVLSDAEFVYFRDSKSLAFAKRQGVTTPVMRFGPDAAFACDLTDDARALGFLAEHNLQPGNFFCCIPRLRYTPYWTIKEHVKFDPVKHARNEAKKEHDHLQLRRAIIELARNTSYKVLVCPEDRTQMAVGKEMLIDRLPADVLQRVVWRPDYWLTGEAVSTYRRSAGLFGNEMHSPIMCIGHGVPAIVCRFAEQTSKGFMWEDIGLGEWLFDLDDEQQV
ncbi:MAG TPA: polysaccharide pyruvyl transferase family protein, partial [Planctomycetaceae bacterium]|nr:polysaccharide pyruvyl transferase family protein [Planctomycetaceae bacterium]